MTGNIAPVAACAFQLPTQIRKLGKAEQPGMRNQPVRTRRHLAAIHDAGSGPEQLGDFLPQFFKSAVTQCRPIISQTSSKD